eukprot:CAMPEP_0203808666 /NCGR_PEP_ID=MMETSP0115-20131106/1743_1 /ASSEMBLY_ACC=CAM_ASM_000227 /TAXON_ID=33651 /ORGANISM="Bicosoecid sp, Strain ms1" /LENGTH=167 /DNA_ID=CAMNT_0050717359 /DNA_START=1 /DNA_END=501 /DNA_ORIENTATION=-
MAGAMPAIKGAAASPARGGPAVEDTSPFPRSPARGAREGLDGDYATSIDAVAALEGHPMLLELMYASRALESPKLLKELQMEAAREDVRRRQMEEAASEAQRSKLRGAFDAQREMFGLRFRMASSLEQHRTNRGADNQVFVRMKGGGLMGVSAETRQRVVDKQAGRS